MYDSRSKVWLARAWQHCLADILDLLEISKFPDIDPQSRDYLIAALATNPKMFIGRSIYQHFAEADPLGTYQGEIMQHLHDI